MLFQKRVPLLFKAGMDNTYPVAAGSAEALGVFRTSDERGGSVNLFLLFPAEFFQIFHNVLFCIPKNTESVSINHH